MLKDCSCPVLEGTKICATCPLPDDWAKHAACLDSDPELFYPIHNENPQITQAIKTCMSCDVRGYCLEMGWLDKHGIWGSFTSADRERIRKAFPLPTMIKERRKIIRIIAHRL